MTADDRKKFIEVVVGFAELKGKQLSAPALELYWRSLQHWDIEDFLAAAENLIRTCEFMPLPKDFEDLRRAGRPTSGEAWCQALEVARNVWPSQLASASCGDSFIDRVVRMIGGYRAIANCGTDKLHFLERRFSEHFESSEEAQEIRDDVPRIAFGRALNGPRRAGDMLSGPENPDA